MVDRVIELRGRGARGAIGLDLIGDPQPGQFVVFNADRQVQGASGTGGGDAALRTDLSQTNGGNLIGLIKNYTGAFSRSVADWFTDNTTVMDFIPFAERVKIRAGIATADHTPYIQSFLDSGVLDAVFPSGQYLHKNITINKAYQRLRGPGAKFTRTDANAKIVVAKAARGVHFMEMRFGCQTSGMEGDNVVVNAPDFRWSFCESRDCDGIPLRFVNCGGGMHVHGGILQTTKEGDDGWDMKVEHDRSLDDDTLYGTFDGIKTNQERGGFWFTGKVGTMACSGQCQFGKFRADNGGSSRLTDCRVNSTTVILSGFVNIKGCNLNGDVTIGKDGEANIGSIAIDSTTVMATYGSLTIRSNVIQSSFHLGQIISAGTPVTIALPAYNNDIWHPARNVADLIDLDAASGSPTKGNGILSAWLSAAGRNRTLRVSFQGGTTTNFGTGNYFTVRAPFLSLGIATGSARLTAAGTIYTCIAYLRDNTNQIKFSPANGATDVNANYPAPLGNGSLLEFSICAEQKN